MKKQFESLKAEKFNALDIEQHQAIRGGIPTATTGKGTVTSGRKEYDYDGDIKYDDGVIKYWVPSLVQYVYADKK